MARRHDVAGILAAESRAGNILKRGRQVTKRTEISIEIDELVVVSAGRTDIPRPPCPVCAARLMVTPEAAAALAQVTVRSLYARVEAESVHFLETPDGSLLLCANSLSQMERFDGLKKLVCATNPVAETPTEKATKHKED